MHRRIRWTYYPAGLGGRAAPTWGWASEAGVAGGRPVCVQGGGVLSFVIFTGLRNGQLVLAVLRAVRRIFMETGHVELGHLVHVGRLEGP